MDINDLVLSDKALSVIDKGEWMEAGPEAPGVEFLVTGMQSESATKLMKQKMAHARKMSRGKALTNEQLSTITKEVLIEDVLKDWKGLESDGKPLAYSQELARKFILSRGGDRFTGMVLNAAQTLDETASSFVEEATKN